MFIIVDKPCLLADLNLWVDEPVPSGITYVIMLSFTKCMDPSLTGKPLTWEVHAILMVQHSIIIVVQCDQFYTWFSWIASNMFFWSFSLSLCILPSREASATILVLFLVKSHQNMWLQLLPPFVPNIDKSFICNAVEQSFLRSIF